MRNVACLVAVLVVACGSSSRDGFLPDPENGGPGSGFDRGSSGGGDGNACVATTVAGTTTKRPVDVVLVVDTSTSMGAAVAAVEQNVNTNFANILIASGIDFRVIALADTSLFCVAPPLGGPACGQPGTRFFQVSMQLGSGNGLSLPLATFPTWSAHLRPGTFKVILQLSDTTSTSDTSAADFDAQLIAKAPPAFGTTAARGYVYHGILGIPAKTPPTDAWLPTDPVLSGGCNANGLAGSAQPAYQELAMMTGGLRYPLCLPASYDIVFKKVAESVVAKSAVPCSLNKPTSSMPIDESTIVVTYSAGGSGGPKDLVQVPGASACKPGAFYVTASTIELCPDACTTVQADTSAKLDIAYGCPPKVR